MPTAPSMRYWLMKSEPDVFSFEHLKAAPGQRQNWDGVRNYQARNYMRDDMKLGDLVLFYHSSCPVPGVAGIAKVSREAIPDHTSWDKKSEYYDPKSSQENPRWFMIELEWAQDFTKLVSLDELRSRPDLADLLILRKGNRLSITPVTKKDFTVIRKLGGAPA